MDANYRFIRDVNGGKIDGDGDSRIEPICKFGPGGDFVSAWPATGAKSAAPSAGWLSKLLNRLAQAIATEPIGAVREGERILYRKQEFENALRDSSSHSAGRLTAEPTDAKTATIIKGDNVFCGGAMLFANDGGTGGRIRYKPKHRIRTYRRASKKRSSAGPAGQGTLFETDFGSARTA